MGEKKSTYIGKKVIEYKGFLVWKSTTGGTENYVALWVYASLKKRFKKISKSKKLREILAKMLPVNFDNLSWMKVVEFKRFITAKHETTGAIENYVVFTLQYFFLHILQN